MRKSKIIFLLAALAPLILSSCGNKKPGAEAKFSYSSILQKNSSGAGGQVPLTIDQSIETDGVLSRDGRYFYYASNRENGNYDIYLRGMDSVITVKITSHPSKDISPAVSPDGGSIAFVSTREDPEGDIYILKINSKSLLKSAKDSIAPVSSIDSNGKNITSMLNPLTKGILSVRDANPVWSPDGKFIAFSSARADGENIWIMESSGKNPRKITSQGGVYPAFSPDGKSLAFVSYREKKSNGDIYLISLESGEERQITSGPAIDLYPSFTSSASEIVFSRIESDTDKNGSIDLRDSSRIYFINIEKGYFYPLTLTGTSSFAPRWFPGFQDGYIGGIILYSEIEEGNINISMIPESGVIPLRATAAEQYGLALVYLNERAEREKFFLAADKTYYSFKNNEDTESIVMVCRSLVRAFSIYKEMKDKSGVKMIAGRLSNYSKEKGLYPKSAIDYIEAESAGRSGIPIIEAYLNKSLKSEKNSIYAPYLIEDLADLNHAERNFSACTALYSRILAEYPEYSGIVSVKRKSAASSLAVSGTISNEGITLLEDENYPQRDSLITEILNYFKNIKNLQLRISSINRAREKHKGSADIIPLFDLAAAQSYIDSGDKQTAAQILVKSLAEPELEKDLIFYLSSVNLGELLTGEKRRVEANRHFFEAAVIYKKDWNDKEFRGMITSLVKHFEEFGERAHNSGRISEAVSLYKNYSFLMSSISSNKEFNDLYNAYASRSHIMYITEYMTLYGGAKLNLLMKDYENSQISAQVNFDKASIYALAYIYVMKALSQEKKKDDDTGDKIGIKGLTLYMKKSIAQIDWAMFIDNTFIEPYVLKSWVFQYMDIKRVEDEGNDDMISAAFPKYLWEKNIPLLERALVINEETINSEIEGTLQLNLANNYFLLQNYPRAQFHYEESKKYKRSFGSKLEQAQFFYHLSICYWQNGTTDKSREELRKTLNIYEALAVGKNKLLYAGQIFTIYKYFALMHRNESNYKDAVMWYYKILDYASANRMKIDRARYLQEIAHCYMELGEFDKAVSNIEQSQKIISKLPDDDNEFNLKVKLAETWTLFSIDLGPDSAVIGDNKIITPLDKKNKMILNFSLLQDISERRNDYGKAIEYLNAKIKIHKKRGQNVDNEAIVIALNNLGYYHFMLKKYSDAAKYFKDARKTAVNNENLEGSFIAINNLTNLYAYAVENQIPDFKNLLSDIDSLTKDIEKYKNTFKKEKYTIEYDKLEKTAKSRGVPVAEEDRITLNEKIDSEAEEVYFTVDISKGILEFYSAELIKKNLFKGSEDPAQAVQLYRKSNELFNYYSSAGNRFTNALESGGKKLYGLLKYKLLINSGVCRQNVGDLSSAKSMFSEAIELAQIYDNPKLLFNAYLNLAWNASASGDYAASLEYYSKGAGIAEEMPLLFTVNIKKIRDLYDGYIKTLIHKGDIKSAFAVAERGRGVERVILVYLSGVKFSSENENRDYDNYTSSLNHYDKSLERISQLINKKESADSDRYLSAREELEKSKTHYRSLLKEISVKSEGVFRYINPSISLDIPAGSSICMIIEDGVDYKILINDGKNTAVKNTAKKEDISLHLRKLQSEGRQIYLVFDGAVAALLKQGMRFPSGILLTQSVSALKLYSGNHKPLPTSVFSSVKGLKPLLEGGMLDITEGSKTDDISGYPIVVDASGKSFLKTINVFAANTQSGSLVEISEMFSAKKARQLLIVKNIEEIDNDYLTLYLEGAAYSGVSAVSFLKGGKPVNFAFAVKEYLGLAQSESAIEPPLAAVLSFTAGYPYDKKEISSAIERVIDEERDRYRKNLISGNFSEARRLLNRWKYLSLYKLNMQIKNETAVKDKSDKGDDAAKSESAVSSETNLLEKNTAEKIKELEVQYNFDSSDIEILSEKYEEAVNILDKTKKLTMDDVKSSDRNNILQAYIFLLKGDISKSKKILSQMTESKDLKIDRIIYSDVRILTSVILCFEESPQAAEKNYKEVKQNELSIIDSRRLKLLYYSALNSCGEQIKIEKRSSPEADYPLSIREKVFAEGKGISVDRKNLSARAVGITEIGSMTLPSVIRAESSRLLMNGAEYDSLSVYAVGSALKKFTDSNDFTSAVNLIENISIKDIAEKSNWMDVIALYGVIADVYLSSGLYEEATEISDSAVSFIEKNHKTAILPLKQFYYKKGIALIKNRNYNEGYKSLISGQKFLLSENDPYNKHYQIALSFLEVTTGGYARGIDRINAIYTDKNLSQAERFTIKMIEACATARKLIEKKSASDEEINVLNALYSSAIDNYNSNEFAELILEEAVSISFEDYIKMSLLNNRNNSALIMADVKRSVFSANFIKSLRRKIIFSPEDSSAIKIISGSALLYFMKIDSDIAVIIAATGTTGSFIIKNGYPALESILDDYNKILPRLENTAGISIRLSELFKDIIPMLEGKRVIYIVTDNSLEDIPFEIIGERELLDEKFSIYYLTSAIDKIDDQQDKTSGLYVFGSDPESIYKSVELSALRTAGIKSSEKGSIFHIHETVSYNRLNRTFNAGKTALHEVVDLRKAVYLPAVEFSVVGKNEFVSASIKGGAGAVIVNDSAIHDINNGVFVESFYESLRKTGNTVKAFDAAKEKLRTKKEFRHPAYWAGLRIYLN